MSTLSATTQKKRATVSNRKRRRNAVEMTHWLLGFLKQERGVLAGVLIGLSIAVAHFIDMQAMQVAGTVRHNHQIGLLAIAAGAGFGGLAGHLFVRSRRQVFAWPAAIALFAAIVSLHFIAMAGVTVVPDGTMLQVRPFTATPNQLSTAVVVAFLALLGVFRRGIRTPFQG